MITTIQFTLDGRQVEVPDDGDTLLGVLRERLGVRSAKDGCSPQGQCGCCTVLVDGQPRVACVTPARRVAGREVTSLEGLDEAVRSRWVDALVATGGSQCGFCTPGIVVRLAALGDPSPDRVEQALLAHLCRCTGWRTILDAANPAASPSLSDGRKAERAAIEGGTTQRVGAEIAMGRGGFADDTAPADALVAVLGAEGEWVVRDTLLEARRAAGKVQGRRTTIDVMHPLEVPPGDWDVTLRTTWVEPAYLEPDASWCVPGGEPASPLANGGAFGGKVASIAPTVARELADKHGRAVRVVFSREDIVRLGPKRPPIAAGVNADGTGVMRVVRTPGVAHAIHAIAPHMTVEEVDVRGLPTSSALRAAGWAEAAVLLAAAGNNDNDNGEPVTIAAPNGARATAAIAPDGSIDITVACGEPLDEVVLRSYCVGAGHMALGWVTSEAIAVDDDGEPHDLTIRSFGILRARDTPIIRVRIDGSDTRGPINGSDAVFVAVAAAAWRAHGYGQDWPLRRRKEAS